MSIGISQCTVSLKAADRLALISGAPYARTSVTVTVTGFTGTAANLLMLIYRNGTLVAQCGAFSGGATLAGTLDLDTAQMETAMTGLDDGLMRHFDVRLWDMSTLALIATGLMEIRQTGYSYATDSGVTGTIVVNYPAGWYLENIDGINFFVARDADGIVYQKIPAPGATPNE